MDKYIKTKKTRPSHCNSGVETKAVKRSRDLPNKFSNKFSNKFVPKFDESK